MKSKLIFIGQSIKSFIKIGAFLPSSKRLAKKMVKDMKSTVILELGPGTGVFTIEILKKLPKNGKLISIESNESFIKYLKDKIKDERLILCNGNALMLKDFLKENGIDKVSYIVSGLPLGHFSKDLKAGILKEIFNCLENDGVFVQFEYFMAGIFSIKKFFPDIKIDFELLNFPPAFVMKCRKSDSLIV